MRQRHRIPTIFSLSMLDVLCCGLGAVILLMMMKFWLTRYSDRDQSRLRELQHQATEAQVEAVAGQELDLTVEMNRAMELMALRSELVQYQRRSATLAQELATAQKSAAEFRALADRLRVESESAAKVMPVLQNDLAAATKYIQALQAELKLVQTRMAEVQSRLDLAQKDGASQAEMLAALELDRAAARANLSQARDLVASLQERLRTTETLRAEAEKLALLVPGLRLQLDSANKRIIELQSDLLLVTRNSQDTRTRLTDVEKQYLILMGEKEAATKRTNDLNLLLTESRRLASATQAKLNETEKHLAGSEELRATLEIDLAAARHSLSQQRTDATAMQNRIYLLDKQRIEIEGLAAQVPMLRLELQNALKRGKEIERDLLQLRTQSDENSLLLNTTLKQKQTVQEDYDKATRRIIELQLELAQARLAAEKTGSQEKTVLIEMNRLQRLLDEQRQASGRLQQRLSQVENRFAGVDLNGRRVVLLVDTSGSMGSVDQNTPDDRKWPEVIRNVVLLLRSLPDLEKYQIIIFSDDAQPLTGKPGEWQHYDASKAPDEVQRLLTAIQPKGNTNMYAAFEMAFRLRDQGMDSIYLFSDGLPNIGSSSATIRSTSEALSQSALLAKQVRDTIREQWNISTPRVRIHSVGFFYESPNLGAFLWALTRENGGSFVGMSRP
jgi:hypothetical protein